MYRLHCKSQNYAWGKKGQSSFVSKFVKNVENESPYAELWMGVHKKGESSVESKEGKVLSIGQPLSIQLHPSKSLAEELFEKEKDFPEERKHYRDPNHKPELAIALTPFECFCGFMGVDEISKKVATVPELLRLLTNGEKLVIKDTAELKTLFCSFINDLKQDEVEISLSETAKRLREKEKRDELETLFLKLFKYYPKDRCCYCAWFFQYLRLETGQSVFIGPHLPHCYIYGDCIECMANSDNVIRSGLTPKYIDKETLTKVIVTEYKNHELIPKKISEGVELFSKEGIWEFKVWKCTVNDGEVNIPLDKSGVAIVIEGEGKIEGELVKVGDVHLIHPTKNVQLISEKKMVVFIATPNL